MHISLGFVGTCFKTPRRSLIVVQSCTNEAAILGHQCGIVYQDRLSDSHLPDHMDVKCQSLNLCG